MCILSHAGGRKFMKWFMEPGYKCTKVLKWPAVNTAHTENYASRRESAAWIDAAILSADVDHGPGGFQEVGLADVVARFLSLNGAMDVGGELFVALSGPHASV